VGEGGWWVLASIIFWYESHTCFIICLVFQQISTLGLQSTISTCVMKKAHWCNEHSHHMLWTLDELLNMNRWLNMVKWVHEYERGLITFHLLLCPCWLHNCFNSSTSQCVYRNAQADEMMQMKRDNAMLIIQCNYHMKVLEYMWTIDLIKLWLSGVELFEGVIKGLDLKWRNEY
jgi:hypothetical protein